MWGDETEADVDSGGLLAVAGMAQVFASGGEVGRLMSTMDWSATPLGAIRCWCAELRMAVGICLDSRFPMAVLWGADAIVLLNDATLPQVGDKYPHCIGRPFREVYPELADDYSPLLERVMSGRGTHWWENQQILVDRRGFLEECFFTFSQSPIRRISTGEVLGVLVTSSETTQEVVSLRRLSCLREIARVTLSAHNSEEVYQRAARAVCRFSVDVPYCLVFLRDQDAGRLSARPVATAGLAAVPATLDCQGVLGLGGLLPEFEAALATGRAMTAKRLVDRVGLRPTANNPAAGRAIVVPLVAAGNEPPLGLLVAGVSDRRALDGEYRTFFSLAAAQMSGAASAADAADAERTRASEARYRSLHDALTGLPNRAALFDHLGQALTEAQQRGSRVGFLFVDLDGFKVVNDLLGHLAGDDLLCDVARRLRSAVRPCDFVGRIGGDEFGVVCDDITSTDDLETVASRVVATVSTFRSHDTRKIDVTVSVGAAVSGLGADTPDELVHAADLAMYTAKRCGPARHLLFDPPTML